MWALLLLAMFAEGGETRYAVSVAEEGSAAVDNRAPGPDAGNLLVLQPSFAYRRGDRFRFSTSLAAVARTQEDTHTQLRVKETYVGFSAGNLDFTAGKRLLRWGTGYAFTATGVLDPPRVATDPADRLNLNEGRELIKADWIEGKHDFTVAWASAGLLTRHRPGMREVTAVRYNVLVKGFDTSLIVAHDRDGPGFAGANFTRVFGEAVELHGEFAWRERAAVLLGGKYTSHSGVTAIAEFYSSAARRHYGFVRVGKSRLRERPGWKEWDVFASLVSNLDDRSRIAVFDAERRFGNHFSSYAHAQVPGGREWRSEYGMIPYSALFSVGIRFQL